MTHDESAMARFGHLRAVIEEALDGICPAGHRVCVLIAEPDGRVCVLSDWIDPESQLIVLRTLCERLEREIAANAPETIVH